MKCDEKSSGGRGDSQKYFLTYKSIHTRRQSASAIGCGSVSTCHLELCPLSGNHKEDYLGTKQTGWGYIREMEERVASMPLLNCGSTIPEAISGFLVSRWYIFSTVNLFSVGFPVVYSPKHPNWSKWVTRPFCMGRDLGESLAYWELYSNSCCLLSTEHTHAPAPESYERWL